MKSSLPAYPIPLLRYLTLLFILLTFPVGCKKDHDEPGLHRLKNCRVEYLFFPDNICFSGIETYSFPSWGITPVVESYTYTGGALSRVTGIFVQVPAGTNLSNFVFSNLAYDSVSTAGNDFRIYSKVPVEGDTIFEFTPNASRFTLSGDKKLVSVHMNNDPYGYGYDLQYHYSGDVITETNGSSSVTRQFFMENGNLVKVLTERSIGHPWVTYRKEILFAGYDNHPNPFQHMYYVPGAFFQAFSVNNFTRYTVNEYHVYSDSILRLSTSRTLLLPVTYNEAGYPMFGDYE